jgi:hypothetical protein
MSAPDEEFVSARPQNHSAPSAPWPLGETGKTGQMAAVGRFWVSLTFSSYCGGPYPLFATGLYGVASAPRELERVHPTLAPADHDHSRRTRVNKLGGAERPLRVRSQPTQGTHAKCGGERDLNLGERWEGAWRHSARSRSVTWRQQQPAQRRLHLFPICPR